MFVWLWKFHECAKVCWFEKHCFFRLLRFTRTSTVSLNAIRVKLHLKCYGENNFLSHSKYVTKNIPMYDRLCEALAGFRSDTNGQNSKLFKPLHIEMTQNRILFIRSTRRNVTHSPCIIHSKTHWHTRALLDRLSGKYTVHKSSWSRIWWMQRRRDELTYNY